MKLITTIDRTLAKVETALLVVFLGGMIVLAFLQVVLRNVFDTGLVWADPLVRHALIWAGFFGGALAAFQGRHISIDAITKYLPDRIKYIAAILTNAFGAVVCWYLTDASLRFLQDEKLGGDTISLGIPLWIAILIIPAGYALIMVHFALKVVENSVSAVHPPPTEEKA